MTLNLLAYKVANVEIFWLRKTGERRTAKWMINERLAIYSIKFSLF